MDTYRGVHKTVFVHIWRIQHPVDFMDDSIHTEVIALCHICLVDEDTALKISQTQSVPIKEIKLKNARL